MSTRWLTLLGALIAAVSFGCGDGEEGEGEVYFDSDAPDFNSPGYGAGGSGGSGATGGSGGSGGAEQAIEEADVIQLQGPRLYALSRYGGLSVVDVSAKDQLKLLGRFELSGEPFEMYIKDGVAFAMYSDFAHQAGWEGPLQWVRPSAVVALDVKNPAKITKLGEFLLPGAISDSKRVGNVLYVVSHENGGCWNCAPGERTNIVSLDVTVPSKVAKVDQLTFAGSDANGSGYRSVMATQDRMFIGGRDPSGAQGSVIDLVDISDPGGKLVKGGSVPVAGSIESRWQMDEKDGVLRVISQPGWWSTADPPVVQTFKVVSSQEIKPLASVPMKLPEPERLRSVRFDGDRGYAITFRQTDPLFVIDLGDPIAPKQVGALVMPGWVFHLEPRGDRLFGLGFDLGNPNGTLNVSLFDVADATQPKLLDRVDFGGESGKLPEDQDRIHKAFTLLDSEGLIFVPHGGNAYQGGCLTWTSAVQIVGFSKDDLVKRGNAPSRGMARRALLHDSRLLTVSDFAVERFDITNQDAPQALGTVPLATVVNRVVAAGDKAVRLGHDQYTSRNALDVVPLSDIARVGENGVDLSSTFSEAGESKCWYAHEVRDLFAHGTHVYASSGWEARVFAVLDVSSGTPAVEGKLTLPAPGLESYSEFHGGDGILDAGRPTVQVGSTLVALRRMARWNAAAKGYDFELLLDVLDFSNPKSPALVNVPLPKALGATALVASGGDVLFSHWTPSPTDPTKVRFYVDRLGLADPAAPQLSSTHTPGPLLAISSAGDRALTTTYQKVVETTDLQTCAEKWGHGHFDDSTGQVGACTGYLLGVALVTLGDAVASVLDTRALDPSRHPFRSALGTDRVYLSTVDKSVEMGLTVLSGLSAGKIHVANVALPKDHLHSTITDLIGDGARAVVLGSDPRWVSVIDAANPITPTFTTVAALVRGRGFHDNPSTVIGDTLVVPRGPYGVDLVDLTP
ncbi:MAG: beta-propeller domain-containing protein [Myxococcales bacterium]|nr:beta-propeller domain-containing protein [Myxococcales bacterium]